MNNTGIIILAAGNSSRLGTAKQLLPFEGKSLLLHTVEQALASQPAVVIVVVGANQADIVPSLANQPISICYNEEWSSGMASSIRKAVQQLITEHPSVENCILSVCDQPYLNTAIFNQLLATYSTSEKEIVASDYGTAIGVPVLFGQNYFQTLLSLEGENGAKIVLKNNMHDVAIISFEKGVIDIDEPEDMTHLITQMITVSEAQDIIKANCQLEHKGIEKIGNVAGYVVAESIVATLDIPNYVQSSMDGYAIKFEDRYKTLTVVDEMPAGRQTAIQLTSGQAVRVFTGAPLPENADTVVMQEKVIREGDNITIDADDLVAGMHVRQKGSEVKKDSLALEVGTVLTAAAIGFLAGIGCEEVVIFKAPKVAIIVTGDELQEVGKPLTFGQVYESNSWQLQAALQQAGVQEFSLYRCEDDREKLNHVLKEALQTADIVLLVGGVSVGDYDFVVQTTLAQQVQPHFHKVKQKPGKPLFFGTKGKQMIFGLPGNPSSALTCFYLYVLPAIDHILHRPNSLITVSAISTVDYSKNKGLTHFIKAELKAGEVIPLHAQESYRLHSYAQANCLMVLDETSSGCQVGDEVEVILLP
ncbi:NTP transferase domain-containing protein [Sphingobacterium sp. SRCM116780]|uniref:NTP transferase domain-containing protein n=1 Tax=Sphingobacterium sp. SRCM116780 TaxID=2907623 RepID=UPI001F15D26C|nr:gephyrin-like molybdotransferase Glp [Sphingobacterium sp. SRCM116780]UIR56851.1 NTP transferase domain-containing protein [Sphingobacterium sp. SRCM116780]